MKEMINIKFYAMILISVIFTGTFSLSPAISSLMSNVTIRSSGTIATISPLYVEGRYIKDSFGNIVYLRGVNKAEWADAPGGIWMGRKIEDYSKWRIEDVEAELDAMKEWGCNLVRCHQALSCWKFNEGNHRQMFKEFLDLCAERGMYVVYDFYSLKPYPEGFPHPLPYPPYQDPDYPHTDVIANEDEFVEAWRSVAIELKDYPNVIFELWNEPHPSEEEAKGSWLNVAQRCIDAIREVGAEQIIIFQWGYGVYTNLPSGGGSGVEWILDFPLTDPTGNLVYSTHIYRVYLGTGKYPYAEEQEKWGDIRAYDYEEIKKAFQFMKIDWVGDTLNKPLFIGETGCDLAFTGVELEHELEAWNNTLAIFNEWGLHYAPFWWRNIGVFRLLKHGEPWIPPPSAGGEILINALQSQV